MTSRESERSIDDYLSRRSFDTYSVTSSIGSKSSVPGGTKRKSYRNTVYGELRKHLKELLETGKSKSREIGMYINQLRCYHLSVLAEMFRSTAEAVIGWLSTLKTNMLAVIKQIKIVHAGNNTNDDLLFHAFFPSMEIFLRNKFDELHDHYHSSYSDLKLSALLTPETTPYTDPIRVVIAYFLAVTVYCIDHMVQQMKMGQALIGLPGSPFEKCASYLKNFLAGKGEDFNNPKQVKEYLEEFKNELTNLSATPSEQMYPGTLRSWLRHPASSITEARKNFSFANPPKQSFFAKAASAGNYFIDGAKYASNKIRGNASPKMIHEKDDYVKAPVLNEQSALYFGDIGQLVDNGQLENYNDREQQELDELKHAIQAVLSAVSESGHMPIHHDAPLYTILTSSEIHDSFRLLSPETMQTLSLKLIDAIQRAVSDKQQKLLAEMKIQQQTAPRLMETKRKSAPPAAQYTDALREDISEWIPTAAAAAEPVAAAAEPVAAAAEPVAAAVHAKSPTRPLLMTGLVPRSTQPTTINAHRYLATPRIVKSRVPSPLGTKRMIPEGNDPSAATKTSPTVAPAATSPVAPDSKSSETDAVLVVHNPRRPNMFKQVYLWAVLVALFFSAGVITAGIQRGIHVDINIRETVIKYTTASGSLRVDMQNITQPSLPPTLLPPPPQAFPQAPIPDVQTVTDKISQQTMSKMRDLTKQLVPYRSAEDVILSSLRLWMQQLSNEAKQALVMSQFQKILMDAELTRRTCQQMTNFQTHIPDRLRRILQDQKHVFPYFVQSGKQIQVFVVDLQSTHPPSKTPTVVFTQPVEASSAPVNANITAKAAATWMARQLTDDEPVSQPVVAPAPENSLITRLVIFLSMMGVIYAAHKVAKNGYPEPVADADYYDNELDNAVRAPPVQRRQDVETADQPPADQLHEDPVYQEVRNVVARAAKTKPKFLAGVFQTGIQTREKPDRTQPMTEQQVLTEPTGVYRYTKSNMRYANT